MKIHRQKSVVEIHDLREPFRYGFFDESGLVYDVTESTSKAEFAKLAVHPNTKPFKYPLENGGYIEVYLGGKQLLDKKYSYDEIWLSADLCYSNFELSGSLTGKLAETYHRVGDIKQKLGDEFSFKGHIFLVLMVIIGGVATFFSIGKLLLH